MNDLQKQLLSLHVLGIIVDYHKEIVYVYCTIQMLEWENARSVQSCPLK